MPKIITFMPKSIPAKPTSADAVEAAPKPASAYTWFEFTRPKAINMTSQGGSKLTLSKGSKFGVRDSSSKKFIRLIGEETGVNKVFTLPFDEVEVLINNCKETKNPL